MKIEDYSTEELKREIERRKPKPTVLETKANEYYSTMLNDFSHGSDYVNRATRAEFHRAGFCAGWKMCIEHYNIQE